MTINMASKFYTATLLSYQSLHKCSLIIYIYVIISITTEIKLAGTAVQ
jgi:hypothetical protein